jgi:hypothetical protein
MPERFCAASAHSPLEKVVMTCPAILGGSCTGRSVRHPIPGAIEFRDIGAGLKNGASGTDFLRGRSPPELRAVIVNAVKGV